MLPGVIGSMQANEVIKILLGKGDVASGRLIIYDALRLKFRELKLRRNPECVLCGDRPSITKLIDYEVFCGLKSPNQDSAGKSAFEISVSELKGKLDHHENFLLLDVREPFEVEISKIEGAELIPLGQLPAL